MTCAASVSTIAAHVTKYAPPGRLRFSAGGARPVSGDGGCTDESSQVLIPNRFDPSKSSGRHASAVPNPRDSRHGAFVAFWKRRRRRLLRGLFRFSILSVVLAATLFAIYQQTEIRRLAFDATLELGIGRCELYVDRKRDLVDWKCFGK